MAGPVVRRRYQAGARGRQEPRSKILVGVCCFTWSKIGSAICFLVSYRTLAAALGQAQNERRTLRFWRRITYCGLINATRPAAAVQVQQRLTSRSAAECSIIAYPQ